MAERDLTTEPRPDGKEAKTSIGPDQARGEILMATSQTRALFKEDEADELIVKFTHQQISDFAVTIDVAAETLAHHFKGQTTPEPKAETEQKPSGPSREAIDAALTSVFQQTALFDGMKAMLSEPTGDLELNLLHLVNMADKERLEILIGLEALER